MKRIHDCTFMSSLLSQLDIVRVALKDPHTPAADPLRSGALDSGLGQARDLGGGTGHSAGRCPGFNGCNGLTITFTRPAT